MLGISTPASENHRDVRKGFVANCFQDPAGKLALGSIPNLPLIVWALARIAGWLIHGTAGRTLDFVSTAALFTWAWLELFQGVNYFRRALGFIVLAAIIVGNS